MLPSLYGGIVKFTSHSSPSRTRAKPSFKLRLPLRIDLISVPLSATPTSSDSSFSYSKRARRLSNVGSLAALLVSPAAAALRATFDFIADQETQRSPRRLRARCRLLVRRWPRGRARCGD